jgi:hypothetical protein
MLANISGYSAELSRTIHFVVAFALLLHVFFWGAGAAMLCVPRPWRRFWPVLVIPAGLALQSAVVWAGAHAGLRGTLTYAGWSELIPAGLLVTGIAIRGMRGVMTDLGRFGVVWGAVGGCLALLVLPVAIASRGLTTLSLGSCDAADYAAGARVLMEFARADREGFLGLVEVVRVHSVDNFFDYWIRLNHFTPSALMAFNGAVLDCAPHEIATLMTAVLLAGTLPVVFWVARALVGYSGVVSLIVAGLYGISPIAWYAVAHVSPGQLIAAQAVALLSWAGISLWRGRLTWRRGFQFAGVLAIGYWLILGSYNFFVVLCLVPAIAYAGGLALFARAWLRFAGWLGIMLAPLLACVVLFFERIAGLAERFTLLQTYDFGWPVPALTAEGWLGMVQGPDLSPWTFLGLRWLLTGAEVALFTWALLRAVQQRLRAVWLLVAVGLPIIVGYLWLEARAAQLGTNASYDAYKLFAVFYPLLLPIACWWVTLRRSRKLHEWLFVCAVGAIVIAFNLVGCGMFVWKMAQPPLIVDGELRQLRRIEAMDDVKSVNLLVPDMWSRLWANSFLLRKEQYFPTHTYEARRNTPLRGEWDLEGGLIAVELPEGGRRQLTRRFGLVNTRHAAFVRAEFGEGWHLPEIDGRSGERWQWSKGEATLQLHNPHDYPVALDASLDGWSPTERRISWRVDGGEPRPKVRLGDQRVVTTLPLVVVPPGQSTLVLETAEPPFHAPGDPRPLGVSVFRFTLSPRVGP